MQRSWKKSGNLPQGSLDPIWILENNRELIREYQSTLGLRFRIRDFGTLGSLSSALEDGLDLPKLLIAEVGMPDGQFLELPQFSKPSGKSLGCPFLVISGCEDPETIRSCFEAGALDYLTKPVCQAELLVKAEKYFSAFDSAAHSKGGVDLPAPGQSSGPGCSPL